MELETFISLYGQRATAEQRMDLVLAFRALEKCGFTKDLTEVKAQIIQAEIYTRGRHRGVYEERKIAEEGRLEQL